VRRGCGAVLGMRRTKREKDINAPRDGGVTMMMTAHPLFDLARTGNVKSRFESTM